MVPDIDGTKDLKEAIDKIDHKLDDFMETASQKYADQRSVDKIEVRVAELEKKRAEDYQWANTEHVELTKSITSECKEIRDRIGEIRSQNQLQTIGFLFQMLITFLGIAAAIAAPFIFHH